MENLGVDADYDFIPSSAIQILIIFGLRYGISCLRHFAVDEIPLTDDDAIAKLTLPTDYSDFGTETYTIVQKYCKSLVQNEYKKEAYACTETHTVH